MLMHSQIFNLNVLNIFVDASVLKTQNETIGCPGCLVVRTDIYGNTIETEYIDYITRDSTNNRSEIRAIRLGIEKALKYRNPFQKINLFSDSNLCIQSITNWIFTWIRGLRDEVIYNSSNTPVINQDMIIDVINTILSNNLDINIFHQKGHVTGTKESIFHATEVFKETNKINTDIDLELIKAISYFNNIVDIRTKESLQMLILYLYNLN
jgi:ribonuclease HI